ncbi:DUF5667 domain-containing protein [Candidatus Methanoperedens nitratireducens]|uniref:DUF5667 domain-containing protein n=1 Tax=Candidatus Methanoperedens nitratireducens TaxID=1392998 RepID=A0A284VSI0_9EURY|nr:DUF5667 domain-containing protein [Candidatus Methanoperedens nitroreducens]SNQ62143.1 exported hypothetical protein [Candidatus Methanoperedens nitroreducens]
MRAIAVVIVMLLIVQSVEAKGDSGWVGPESFLYPLKVWMEKLSINLISSQEEKDLKMLDLAEERLAEAEEMENNSKAFEKAMDEYTEQLEELHGAIEKNADNGTKKINVGIKERIESHKNRTKNLKSSLRASVVQQSIIEASSSAGGSRINVSSINGNVSVQTEGGNATVTRDGSNVTVVSVTNNSRQVVVINSSRNGSSSSVSVRSSSKAVVSTG